MKDADPTDAAVSLLYETVLDASRWNAALAALATAFDAPMVAFWRYDFMSCVAHRSHLGTRHGVARHLLRAIVLAAWLGACGAAPAQEGTVIPDADSSAPAPEASLHGAQLLAALRGGGYVIYFRHTATDFSRDDSRMTGYADCANQRPLNEQGRRDAQAIGAAVRELGLPVAEALASPFCRTLEHARLMLVEVSPRMEVREAQAGDYAGLKRLLATPVAAGGNRWIVGHGIPFRAVAGPPHLAEGEAAVIRPHTTGWTVVARLQVADWQALASAAR